MNEKRDSHIVPTDEDFHELSSSCSCSPRVDEGVPSPHGRIWVHQAKGDVDPPERRWALWDVPAASVST